MSYFLTWPKPEIATTYRIDKNKGDRKSPTQSAGQLKDLAARAENASPGEWQIMARQFEELKMNMEQIRHALEELGKIKSKGGIRSRGITV